MRFYIKYETAQEGPFDLISMVRKIRSGSVSADLLVLEEKDEAARPAGEHPELHGFFREMEQNPARSESAARRIGFFSALRQGVNFLISYHFSAVYSAVIIACPLLLATMLAAALPSFMAPLSALLSWIFFQFLLSILMFLFLRLHRGQTHDPSSVYPFIQRSIIPLIFCAALVGVFSAVGGLILVAPGMLTLALTIPGIVILALYSFAPLLIIEHGYDFWDAMEASRKAILKQGRPLFEIVFGFALINVLAGFLYVLPLAVALPITYGALVEIFDEMDFH